MVKAGKRAVRRVRRPRAIALVAVLLTALGMQLLPTPAAAATFTNPTRIHIIGLGPTGPANTPATPYPSDIVVSGMTGTVTDVNLTLNGLDCSDNPAIQDWPYPEDLDMLLVGPTGANLVVFSDIGGENDTGPTPPTPPTPPYGFPAINVTLDDQAAQPLPADTQLSAGTYRPLDDDNDPIENVPVDTFPARGQNPSEPLVFITPSGATALSVFNGTDPNGTWSLYVVDDYAGPDNCEINGGWTLDILTTGTGPTTTTVAPTTTTVAPTTTTVAPTTTTAAPTTTTAAPTTTTAAPTTTTAAPTTTTVAPTTTTAAPTTTTVAPTTTTAAPTTTTAAPTTTTAAPTTTTVAPTTTTAAPTTTTAGPTTTTMGPTTTTAGPTTTTVVTPDGPLTIDDTALSNGEAVRITGTITCDEGMRFRLAVTVTQGDTEATGVATGSCTGEEQTFRVNIRNSTGPGFEEGPATVDATAQIGDPDTRAIVDTFSTSEEVEIDIPSGFMSSVVSAFSAMGRP